MGILNIRDLSDAAIVGIDLAWRHGPQQYRSREAYMRTHIDVTFGPAPEGLNTTLGIAMRFRDVVDTFVRLREEYKVPTQFSIAHIARELGHPNTATLDAYMRLDVPVSFEDLDRFIDLYRVDRSYLETGKGAPFYQRARHHDAVEAIRDLYVNGCPYDHLCFVLSDEERGEAMIYGVSAHDYTLLADEIPVHAHVGGSGHINLVEFATFLRAIIHLKHSPRDFFRRAGGGSHIRTIGMIFNPDEYRTLARGALHPADILGAPGRSRSNWHEDLPDLEYGSSAYSRSYDAARKLYVDDLAARGITNNKQLADAIEERLKMWQPSDFDLAQMLRAKDGDSAKPFEHYSEIVDAARAGDNQAQNKIVEDLFWKTRIAMPDWLGRF